MSMCSFGLKGPGFNETLRPNSRNVFVGRTLAKNKPNGSCFDVSKTQANADYREGDSQAKSCPTEDPT